jgi:hypothetical protein
MNKESITHLMKLMTGAHHMAQGRDPTNMFVYLISNFILDGLSEAAGCVVSQLWEKTHYGYNELHNLALKEDADLEKLKTFRSVSVSKKANTCNSMTPLHFACINPNT